MSHSIVNIAINAPLYQLFSYSCDFEVKIGQRVVVEFGRRREEVGIIWETNVDPQSLEFDLSKLKPVLKVLPEIIDSKVIGIIKFIINYYHYPIGQTIFGCLPNLWSKVKVPKAQQKTILTDKLATKDAFIKPKLNDEQLQIVNQIAKHKDHFYPVLLHGITGSGKTEVYMELLELLILEGKQALVLVPEINLTPQLEERFKKRFPNLIIHVLTSKVLGTKRLDGYLKAQIGEAHIIIGTRLAVFTPFKNLGIIVIDEEHDSSFKQTESLCYHARDVAVFRAKSTNIPIVLGSATPSLESLYNCNINKYNLVKLSSRAVEDAQQPQIKLLDLNICSNTNGIAQEIIDSIAERIKKQEISIIFINRRGYAPLISCYECDWVAKCKHCSANLVFHNTHEGKNRKLKCHYCGYVEQVPAKCPKCANIYLQAHGQGTQKIEEFLLDHFKEARIFRIDQDTVNNAKAWEELYNKIKNNEVDVLIGTQMLAKGHDFPNITLVAALEVDSGLYSYDFRAQEILFAKLAQVAGRAGRGNKKGTVLIQTRHPTHPLYGYLLNHDFGGFANYLLNLRKELTLPPYSYHAIFRVSANKMSFALNYLKKIYKVALELPTLDVVVYPPVPALMQRVNNKDRAQILITGYNRKSLHDFLEALLRNVATVKSHRINWLIEVDPLDI